MVNKQTTKRTSARINFLTYNWPITGKIGVSLLLILERLGPPELAHCCSKLHFSLVIFGQSPYHTDSILKLDARQDNAIASPNEWNLHAVECPRWEINRKTIDFNTNTLTDDQTTTKLEPMVAAVLQALVEHRGIVVSREYLAEKVWQGRVVSAGSINRNISILRRLLGDRLYGQSCIKTVPKKGYLLFEDVCSPLDAAASHNKSDSEDAVKESEGQLRENESEMAEVVSVEAEAERELNKGSTWAGVMWPSTLSLNGPGKRGIAAIAILTPLAILVFGILQGTVLRKFPDEIASSPIGAHISLEQQLVIRPSEQGEAFCLDGQQDYIEITKDKGIIIGKEDFSLAVWFKSNNQDLVTIVDQRDEKTQKSTKGYSLFLYEGRPGLQMGDKDDGWYCRSGDPTAACTNWIIDDYVADGEWHHLAVTVDRDQLDGIRFYLDGKFVAKKDPTLFQGSLATANPMRVGSRSSSKSSLFDGAIGEVGVYNYLLPPEQISAAFAKGSSGSCES